MLSLPLSLPYVVTLPTVRVVGELKSCVADVSYKGHRKGKREREKNRNTISDTNEFFPFIDRHRSVDRMPRIVIIKSIVTSYSV